MSHLGCICGYSIADQTDFLPYKAYILKDEDTEAPVERLADMLAQYWEARERGAEADFIRSYSTFLGKAAASADREVERLTGRPMAEVLYALVFPVWNDYQRVIYECENCGRLWVQTAGNRWAPYKPETSERHVFRSDAT